MVETKLTFFAGKSHFLAEEYVNANDVTAFCRYFMNKMRRNFINISGVDVGSMWGRCRARCRVDVVRVRK